MTFCQFSGIPFYLGLIWFWSELRHISFFIPSAFAQRPVWRNSHRKQNSETSILRIEQQFDVFASRDKSDASRDGLLEGGDRAEEEVDGGGQGAQVLGAGRQQILQEGRASQETGEEDHDLELKLYIILKNQFANHAISVIKDEDYHRREAEERRRKEEKEEEKKRKLRDVHNRILKDVSWMKLLAFDKTVEIKVSKSN